MITQHAGHSAKTKHTAGAPHFLLTSDDTTLAELELALAALPLVLLGLPRHGASEARAGGA